MHFLFIDSSVNNVLLPTSTSCFKFIDVPKQRFINSLQHNTANIVEWTVIRAGRGYISGVIKFTDFFFISTHVAFVFFSPASDSWEFEWPLDGQLYQKCLYQKLLKYYYSSPSCCE